MCPTYSAEDLRSCPTKRLTTIKTFRSCCRLPVVVGGVAVVTVVDVFKLNCENMSSSFQRYEAQYEPKSDPSTAENTIAS